MEAASCPLQSAFSWRRPWLRLPLISSPLCAAVRRCAPLCSAVLRCAPLCVLVVGEAGKGCQRTQKLISDLCYHEKFAADAVLMRKPIQGKSSSGRTFVLPSAAGKKRGKRGRETAFVKIRNDLVEHKLIPKCVFVLSSS